ncbi:prolyl-tRNA editing enzyme YbaK/EbsC (Cys-tRNA(Pro) deacylase) [Arthrobacter sp. B3I9]|uniref:YbaK/EbsC family protein n=1 Tax=Arthrobacter sp. B3I9 TaxID=3042270 RepID=UPI002793BCDF|nr:YbaK/EbsC family protein [Arthrobacter sp. B3I9]MDQ0850450.1 prolyl-tRNA editing enzyme YbaK/EbsC (Cys-tRNA(Pro) deacylase) [Arthrobacter sp. B3I9]
MTDTILQPSVADALGAHGISHEVLACSPDLADTAEFCEHYGFTLDQAANTILVSSKKVDPPRYAVCVVLGTTRLDVNRCVRNLLDVKRASFADAETTIAVTGMLVGGVTAAGIDGLPIYVDRAVMDTPRVVMGGGNRTSKIVLAPAELLKLPGLEVVEGLATPAATAGLSQD